MKETKFKQTEVGMIPSDWEVTTIGDFCKVYDGTHQTPNYVDFGIPFYSVENVSADDFEHTKYISLKEYTQISKRANIVKGDILMTRIGSIGVCKYVDWNCKAGFYVSLALLKCNDSVDARFICHLSNSENFKREIELHSLLTAIPQKINLGPISNVRIALPKKLEQQRIANALSDIDTLIANLEKLIAKKKNIKQGAMQQLLTGKKRLPGFAPAKPTYKQTELGMIPTDWESINLGSIADIRTGKRNGDESEMFGKYPFFVRSQTVYRINSYSFDGEAILIPGEGGIGSIFHYINGKFDYHQRVYKISDFSVNFSANITARVL